MFRSKPNKEDDPPLAHQPQDEAIFHEYARKSNLPPLESEGWQRDAILVPSIRGKHITYISSQTRSNSKTNHTFDYTTPPPSGSEGSCSLPTDGSVVQIRSSLFEGKLITRIRDDSHKASNCKYFQNRSRTYNWAVQGRFLQRTRFDDVITGQEFERPFRHKPSSQIVQRLLDMLKTKLPDSFECDFLADEPFFHHPLLAGCQHFNVSAADCSAEDELHGISPDGNVIEDTSLLNDDSIPSSGEDRRKYFSKKENLSRFYFEPDLIYTFDFYSNFFSPTKFSLEIGPLLSIDLIPYFNGFPLFLSMAKDKSSGEYLWATEIWHKRLLNYQETPGRLARWFGD